jgi:hypothetical protein
MMLSMFTTKLWSAFGAKVGTQHLLRYQSWERMFAAAINSARMSWFAQHEIKNLLTLKQPSLQINLQTIHDHEYSYL